ncbi:hypothetical protein [Lapillicoccus jejuensis]|uniref:Uncharacterized protein n=1 Tax=Lapillicoccus jejuensis TaxID=402171 RepID=A0A542E214_9MICO|nr:hypothetical protein [Lapillicoccus jejuensis]TQJ09345.1 hypothetical protein FB458_2455 [Lapillicoccus jejuensis]
MTQPPTPPPYGAPYGQGQPFPPPGHLVVHLQGSWLISFVTPTLFLDGQRVPAKYGENHFPVAPGRHVVAGQAEYMLTYGRAHLEADLAPDQRVDVWYAAPWHQFAKQGSIGFEKQKHRGAWLIWSLFALLALVVVLVVVAGLSSS